MRDFQRPGRSLVIAQNGMAATSHPLASKVAVQILESGGNAADAAIAAGVLLGICEPQMTGIGGDCFVLVKPAGEDRLVGLNGSGRAPAGLDADALRATGHATMPTHTADAVTLPGAVDAFVRLSEDWGRCGLATSLAPAIHYAEQGVPVAPRVAFDWAVSADVLQGTARDDYALDGKALRQGQVFRSPKQAKALRLIAEHGRDGFYDGPVAEDLIAGLQAAGGSHTLDDLAATACDYVDPISTDYRGHELVELPPNGQGAAALLLTNILAEFDLASLNPNSAARVHIEAEATKLAYDARNRFVADPTMADTRLEHLVSRKTAQELAALIDLDRALPHPATASEAVHKETVYLTVVDRDRMAVSLIYSIFHSFGSGIASPKYGILYHNRGAGFSLQAGHPNEAASGKRPMHTIIPAMLRKDGKVLMSFGVMGGQYQSAGHARFLSNIADYGMDPQAAMDAPRSFAEAGVLSIERGYDAAVAEDLRALGHTVDVTDKPIGGSQAILLDDDVLVGASDPRKDGCALGY